MSNTVLVGIYVSIYLGVCIKKHHLIMGLFGVFWRIRGGGGARGVNIGTVGWLHGGTGIVIYPEPGHHSFVKNLKVILGHPNLRS